MGDSEIFGDYENLGLLRIIGISNFEFPIPNQA